MKLNEYETKWLENFDATESKKQRSYSGCRSYKDFPNIEKETGCKFDLRKLHKIGGDNLVILYLCGSNFELAAKELGIKTNSLHKYIARLRSKLEKNNISRQDFQKIVKRVH